MFILEIPTLLREIVLALIRQTQLFEYIMYSQLHKVAQLLKISKPCLNSFDYLCCNLCRWFVKSLAGSSTICILAIRNLFGFKNSVCLSTKLQTLHYLPALVGSVQHYVLFSFLSKGRDLSSHFFLASVLPKIHIFLRFIHVVHCYRMINNFFNKSTFTSWFQLYFHPSQICTRKHKS